MIINEHFKGSIRTIILHLLSQKEEMYGYEICQCVSLKSKHEIQFTEGAIYPALHRMEKKGLIKSKKTIIDGRVRKYYSITPLGTQESIKHIDSFISLTKAMQMVLGIKLKPENLK